MSRAHIEHGGEQELEAGRPRYGAGRAGAGQSARRALLGLGLLGLLGALGSAAGCGGATESSPAEPASEPAALGEAQSALSTATLCLKIPAVDTTLSKEKPYDNYGTGSFLSSGASATGVPTQFRTLLKFNTKAVPQEATVISAKVSLSQTNTGVAKPGVHLVI